MPIEVSEILSDPIVWALVIVYIPWWLPIDAITGERCWYEELKNFPPTVLCDGIAWTPTNYNVMAFSSYKL